MQGSFSEDSLKLFSKLVSEVRGSDFSESESSYDFTRCVRPDGSAYGTRGKCKKGTEAAKEVAQTPSSSSKGERLENKPPKMKMPKALWNAVKEEAQGYTHDTDLSKLTEQDWKKAARDYKAGGSTQDIATKLVALADSRDAKRIKELMEPPSPKGAKEPKKAPAPKVEEGRKLFGQVTKAVKEAAEGPNYTSDLSKLSKNDWKQAIKDVQSGKSLEEVSDRLVDLADSRDKKRVREIMEPQ